MLATLKVTEALLREAALLHPEGIDVVRVHGMRGAVALRRGRLEEARRQLELARRLVARGHRLADAAKIDKIVRTAGIGISEDNHHKIFKMFERLSAGNEYEGTGIGLAIVAKAVERMGGAVTLESTLGQGTTFCIELPAAEQ